MQKQESTIYDHYNTPVFFQAENAGVVTPSDSTVLQTGVLYVGTAGDVVVTTKGGSTVTFANVAAGSFLPVVVTKVLAATTAEDILVLY